MLIWKKSSNRERLKISKREMSLNTNFFQTDSD